eukprot:1332009-Pyramimonas_sp.AAC.1
MSLSAPDVIGRGARGLPIRRSLKARSCQNVAIVHSILVARFASPRQLQQRPRKAPKESQTHIKHRSP